MATALQLATFPVAMNDAEEISLREISSDLRFLFGEFEALDLDIFVRTRKERKKASLSDRTVDPVKKRKVEGLKTKDPW